MQIKLHKTKQEEMYSMLFELKSEYQKLREEQK